MQPLDGQTLPDLLARRAATTPNALAFQFPERDGSGWSGLTWRAAATRVRALARGLLAEGLAPGSTVALVASNRVEWLLVEFAILEAGLVSCALPRSLPDEALAFAISEARASLAFVDDREQAARLAAQRGALSALSRVVLLDDEGADEPWLRSLAELERRGVGSVEAPPRARPDALATIRYTAGSTGRPRGAQLTHDAWVAQAESLAASGLLHREDHQLLGLPLAHTAAQGLLVAQLAVGFTTTLVRDATGALECFAQVRPTFAAAPPQLLERLLEHLLFDAEARGGARERLLRRALRAGREAVPPLAAGSRPRGLRGLEYRLHDRLVFSGMRRRLGGRLRFFLTGGAPLPHDLGETFFAAGLPILESYGVTEAAAASCLNLPERCRLGAAGLPLPGVEVRVAEDGEILLGGRCLMHGYLGQPEATAAALRGGWLHTGDLGHLDENGFLWVTGRKSEGREP
jgi:long-chain acyl-CoA synthetase